MSSLHFTGVESPGTTICLLYILLRGTPYADLAQLEQCRHIVSLTHSRGLAFSRLGASRTAEAEIEKFGDLGKLLGVILGEVRHTRFP